MPKRHSDAIAINCGACNPSGIAHSIVQACQEIRAEPAFTGTDQLRQDPALRLMVHQLAFLMGLSVDWPMDSYVTAVEACEAAIKVAEPKPAIHHIVYGRMDNGDFAAVDHVTKTAVVGFATGIYSSRAYRDPEGTARDMILTDIRDKRQTGPEQYRKLTAILGKPGQSLLIYE